MNRRFYETPEAEIERYTLNDILTASTGGINDGDTGIDLGDDF